MDNASVVARGKGRGGGKRDKGVASKGQHEVPGGDGNFCLDHTDARGTVLWRHVNARGIHDGLEMWFNFKN